MVEDMVKVEGDRKATEKVESMKAETVEVAEAPAGAQASKKQHSQEWVADLPMAPTLRPTAEEFADPLRYVAKLKAEGYEKFGIVKIIPPVEWKPDFALNRKDLRFGTRIQAVNELQRRFHIAAKCRLFRDKVEEFCREKGLPPPKMPTIYGHKLNMYKLYTAVQSRGGFHTVTEAKKWREVGSTIVPNHKAVTNISFILKTTYEKHLLAYEGANMARGADLELDTTQMDSLLQACGLHDTPNAKGAGEGKLGGGPEEAQRGVAAGDASLAKQDYVNGDCELQAMDGLMNLTAPGGGEAPQSPPAPPVKRELKLEEKVGMVIDQVEIASARDAVGLEEGGTAEEEPDEKEGGRKRQRPKREAAKRKPEEEAGEFDLDNINCERCGGGAHEDKIILCDRCNKGFHLFCLSPPLKRVPEGDWSCPECISVATDELAFIPGPDFSFPEFQQQADKFVAKWYQRHGEGATQVPPSWREAEHGFWDIVENFEEPVEVFYGADLDSATFGSGFPQKRNGSEENAYTESGWNLNNLPRLEGEHSSMLRHLKENINGVTVPWVYMGMLFSSFCWHVEDHMLYSINYNHMGAPKVWYGVSSAHALDFEDVFRKYMPEQFRLQPDLLFQLVTMLSPRLLLESSVPVHRVVQEEGSFVITFPRAYHGGFNAGFNCAEAVNFAPADWFSFGATAVQRYQHFRKSPILSHDSLLCKVSELDASCTTARHVLPQLEAVARRELDLRSMLFASGTTNFVRVASLRGKKEARESEEDDVGCAICKIDLCFSICECSCTKGYRVCLEHVDMMCACDPRERTVSYTKTVAELEDMHDLVNQRLKDSAKTMCSPRLDCETEERKDDADTWSFRASRLLKAGHTRRERVEDMIAEAQEFLWGGKAMDIVRDRVKDLEDVLAWGNEVARWSSSHKRKKVTLSHLKGLLSRKPVPLDIDLSRLEAWCKNAVWMDERAGSIVQGKFPHWDHSEILAFYSKVHNFIVIVPMLEALTAAVDQAKQWAVQVNDFLAAPQSSKGTVALLNSIKAQGTTIQWNMAEKDRIQKAVEDLAVFQVKADKLLQTKIPLKALNALGGETSNLPVIVPQANEIISRLEASQQWLKKFEHEENLDCPKAPHLSMRPDKEKLSRLRKLLHSGERIAVEMKQVSTLRLKVRKLEWTESATRALKRGAKSRPTMVVVEALVKEGSELGLGHENSFMKTAKSMLEAMQSWTSSYQNLLAGEHDPSLEHLKIVAEEGNKIGLMVDCLKSLNKRLEGIANWKLRVQMRLDEVSNRMRSGLLPVFPLSELQDFVSEVDPKMKPSEQMVALLALQDAVMDWRKKAAFIRDKSSTLSDWTPSEFDAAEEVLSEGKEMGILHDELCQAEKKVLCVRWNRSATKLLAPVEHGTLSNVKYSDWVALIAKGESLPVDSEIMAAMQHIKAKVDEITAKVSSLFHGDTSQMMTLEELEQIDQDCRRLPLSFDAGEEAITRYAEMKVWDRKTNYLFRDALQVRPPLDEYVKWRSSYLYGRYSSERYGIYANQASDEIGKAQKWLLSCAKVIIKNLKEIKHTHCDALKVLETSVQTMLDNLQPFCMDCNGQDQLQQKQQCTSVYQGLHGCDDASAPGLASEGTNSNVHKVCICGQGSSDVKGSKILHCQYCDSVFHTKCLLGLANDYSKFYNASDLQAYGINARPGASPTCCPFCLAERGLCLPLLKMQWLYKRYIAWRVSKRPTDSALVSLLAKGRSIHAAGLLRVPEVDILERIVMKLAKVKEALTQIAKRCAGSVLDNPEGKLPTHRLNPMEASHLILFWKKHMSCEINLELDKIVVEPYPCSLEKALLTLVYGEAFRMKVTRCLADGAAPMPPSSFALIVEEADHFYWRTGDQNLLTFLLDVEENGRTWEVEANRIIADLTVPLEQARLHLEGADQLRSVDKETVEALQERCTLYCICRQPYDANRGMVECETCAEWYHYDCVGLSETEAQKLKSFVCSTCRTPPGVAAAAKLMGESAENTRERESTLYCICRQPYDGKKAMIECESCQDWFHFDCVGICEGTNVDKFLCAKCKCRPPEGASADLLEVDASVEAPEQQPVAAINQHMITTSQNGLICS